MSACLGCSCVRPMPAGDGERLLLSTRVSHNQRSLRTVLRAAGADVVERAPGLLEVSAADPAAVLAAARRSLTATEAAEVRAVVLTDETGDALLGAAFGAPTLAQLGARVEHADLVPLFADEERAFRSVYQPIVALDRESERPVIGYEALLRATGPDGPLLPGELFAAAHDAGWLHVLDRVGRTTALRGAEGWLGDALLFVNFIPTTIYRPEVCLATTERAAVQAGLRLDQLVFEVTESERIGDLDHLADVFAYYRERGCQVALDDLGAGYSSLNVLVRLQPDIVKLDKDIVQRLPGSTAAAVVAAVVDITHSYGGTVLAECIETEEQAEAARGLGVDLGQGWHFGRPEERMAVLRPAGTAREQAAAASAWAAGPGRDGNDAAVAMSGAPATAAVPTPRPASTEAAVPAVGGLQELLGTALQVSATGVSVVDATVPDLPLVYVNPAFELLTGYSADEVLGRNCRFLQGAETDADAVRDLRDAVAAGRDWVTVLRNYRKDGQAWWNELRLSAVRDDTGSVTHYFGFQNDVTERVDARREVEHLAFHDPLTGLPNRAHVLGGLAAALRTARAAGDRLAVLFVDLDGFKDVNDRLGHAAGDLALTAAGARLRNVLRDQDLLGRLSGDEFLAVLPGVAPDVARTIAQRTADAVRDTLRSPLASSPEPVELGASVGVALFPEDGSDVETLLQVADRAMYAAKQTGRGLALLAGDVLR